MCLFLRLFKTFAFALKKATFRNPPQASILIFDREGSEILGPLVFNEIAYSVLPVRHEQFYFTASIFFRMLRNLKYLDNLKPGQFFKIYLLSCVQIIDPQVVVTYMDYDICFQSLSRIHRKATFLAVQNGVKLPVDITSPSQFPGGFLPNPPNWGHRISFPTLYSFGQYEETLYKKYGQIVDKFIPVGSIRGSYYKTEIAPKNVMTRYDLCLVSQWRRSIFAGEIYPDLNKGLTTLHEFLKTYLGERDLKVAVAIRAAPDQALERQYFEKFFGSRAQLICSNGHDSSTYRTMDESNVIVGLHSAAVFEAFGWKKKVLFSNFTGNPVHSCPIEGVFAIHEANYERFRDRLDELLQMQQDDYERRVGNGFSYLMAHDDHNPAHRTIRKAVLDAIHRV